MNWFAFGSWLVVGLLNLFNPAGITKFSYGVVWAVLMIGLLCNAIGGD